MKRGTWWEPSNELKWLFQCNDEPDLYMENGWTSPFPSIKKWFFQPSSRWKFIFPVFLPQLVPGALNNHYVFNRSSVFHTQFFHGKDVEIIIQLKRWHFPKRMALGFQVYSETPLFHASIYKWLFQLDDCKSLHWHEKWLEITISIHLKTGWLPGTRRMYTYTWYPKQPFFFGCFNGMMGTPNL